MEDTKPETKEKQPYEAPKVLATYDKEELEETIKPHGPGGAYACGCGSIL